MSQQDTFAQVAVGAGRFHACTEVEVVSAVRAALRRGVGGRIITPNVDILRQARRDPAVRGYLADASLVVADGMPLVWASRLAGTPLPERVAGSSLVRSLAAGLAHDRRSLYLLGGAPATAGTDGDPDGALRAAATLAHAHPGLRIAGAHSPAYGFEKDPAALDAVCAAVAAARPDLVCVGVGFPKQESVISVLRRRRPGAWYLGCGAAINFVAGDQHRAPAWMQRSGLEWAHRLAAEPRRLAGRYLGHDAPYALGLLARATLTRYRPAPAPRPRS
ncbi:WecB/TagA/CpsF family glycosyltransferase [Pilimelia terevasa]|uniref:WecB/TagA/CpsF family glycosyltransferase n=1 Tax=Pilimelia terevasa TaxID=53372 RepID=UPI001E56A1CD|nr:WecB/TagA/CpsF family glycosyltransferase [Pilimelia terevasa]